MKERCIIIPAIKKNAVIPDQLVKKLSGITLMERALNTARAVVPTKDIITLTDSQEISLICERIGSCFHLNKDLKFKSLDIINEMQGLLEELSRIYAHSIILRASCPLLTWIDVENAWKDYKKTNADSLITVRNIRQRIWNINEGTLNDAIYGNDTNQEFLIESRALIILNLKKRLSQQKKIIPFYLDEHAIEIQSYQDWWICEHLLKRRHIVFVVAGYPAIGMGHVYRALMLAHEITDHKVTFVCTNKSELAVDSLASKDYHVIRQGKEELYQTVLSLKPDLVINDFLNTPLSYMQALKNAKIRCINFEDDGQGIKYANLVINALYEKQSGNKKIKYGEDYFCLRDEFLDAKQNILRDCVRTILITFGGTDQNDASRRILNIIEPIARAYGIKIRIVAGPGYAHRKKMELHLKKLENPLISFTWATNAMSNMMEGADLAICSAGRTVYELAHMRIPAMVLAHHEREARHTFVRPKNGFAFVGIMDKITDTKIRNVFLAMLKQDRRARFWKRQTTLDFTKNKAKVIRLILKTLLKDET